MKIRFFYLINLYISTSLSYSLIIKEDFNYEISSTLTENIFCPIGGKAIIISPEWLLTTLDANNINQVTILDQEYTSVCKKSIGEFSLLQINHPTYESSVQRWRQIGFLEKSLKIFSDFSNTHLLTLNKPYLAGKINVPVIQTNNLDPEEQVYLENSDQGRGVFLETPHERLLCGQVINQNKITFLNPNINGKIDYFILCSVLGLTENFVNVKGEKGVIIAPQWILTNLPKPNIYEVEISNQKYKIIYKIRLGQFFLLKTDRCIDQNSIQRRSRANTIEQILNTPLNPNINNQIDYNVLCDALGNEPIFSNNKPKNTNTQNQSNPWVMMVYINDEDAGNYYTSCCATLNSLCQALNNSPSNNTVIIAQTTIPEPGPDFDQEYFNLREEMLQPHLEYIAPELKNKISNAKGVVRFILSKQGNNLKVDTERVGPSSIDLSTSQAIKEFLNYGNRFEGRKMFYLYAHGRGWQMVSQDKTPLSTIEFAKGFINAPLDILRMDSCRSQMIETLYEVTRYNPKIKYSVGSQQITALDGAIDTYERLMSVAGNYNNPFDYAKLQTQDKIDNNTFNKAYDSIEAVNNGNGLTYSTINLEEIPTLTKSINELAGSLLEYAKHKKDKVLDWLKEIRQNGIWFDDASEIRKKLNRNDRFLAQNIDYYYDLFHIIDLITEKAAQNIKQEFKDVHIDCCNKIMYYCNEIKKLQPKVVLENHVSKTHPFSHIPNGLSIDFSPREKFFNPVFDNPYKNLAFSNNGRSNWYKLLNLK